MKDFDAGRLANLTLGIDRFLRSPNASTPGRQLTPEERHLGEETFRPVMEVCVLLVLESPLALLVEIYATLGRDGATWGDLTAQVSDLNSRIIHALAFRRFLSVDAVDTELWTDLIPFGPEVSVSFPSATYDIEESAKCLVVGRSTAAVFHLMRTLELAMRVLMSDMGEPYDPRRHGDWTTMLSKATQHLATAGEKRQFYQDSVTMLTAVKFSWRNPTLHPNRTYTQEEAREVWGQVRTFMRHLATQLSE